MPSLPRSLRLVNRVGRAWRAAGGSPRPIHADALVEEVLQACGRTDLGPESEYREGLEVVTRGLADAPHLSTVGRMMVRRQVRGSLLQRAARAGWKAAAPERFKTPLRTPLVIVGLPRTGTTFLHHLLSSAPQTRTLAMWEVAKPFPPVQGPDRRKTDNARAADWVLASMPDFAQKHNTGREAPEECMHVMNLAFFTWTWWSAHAIGGYRDWLQTADPGAAYGVWSDVLRFHQADDPQRRFVLKSPSHSAYLDALLAAVPEARVVFTHRDVRSVVPSFASLVQTLREATHARGALDPHALGREVLDHLADTADRARRLRAQVPADRLFDVQFDDLRQRPVEVMRDIHAHFDLGWDEPMQAAAAGLVRAQAGHKKSTHRYTASHYGLTDDQIVARIPPID